MIRKNVTQKRIRKRAKLLMRLARSLNMTYNKALFYLCVILSVKAILMSLVILAGPIHLGPDEAQYWTWSRALDWGYYSKPPGIAWQIALGIKLFGDTELGVRFFSLLFSFGISVGVFFLAKSCRLAPMTAFWSGLVCALSPLGILASLFAITDLGMLFFWTLSCILLVDGLASQRAPSYLLIGLTILCGALFKWPIYFFWLLILSLLPFYSFLRQPKILLGILLSLLGLLPSIFWNYTHEWVTFRHVLATVLGHSKDHQEHPQLFHGNFIEFIGAQVALLSPILFIVWILAGVYLYRIRKSASPSLVFCGFSSLAVLLLFILNSLIQKMQGNWAIFVYPTGMILLTWYACEVLIKGKVVLFVGVLSSVLLTFFALQLPYRINPFKHNLGWDQLAVALHERGYNPQEHFLFGDKYQMSSLLSFYPSEQKRAYFLNVRSCRRNQFSFWPSMAVEQLGKTGYFVLAESRSDFSKDISFYETTLKDYFRSVEFLGTVPLISPHKSALIFKCIDYNGKEPTIPDLY